MKLLCERVVKRREEGRRHLEPLSVGEKRPARKISCPFFWNSSVGPEASGGRSGTWAGVSSPSTSTLEQTRLWLQILWIFGGPAKPRGLHLGEPALHSLQLR